jgi:hypothetical protein
MVHSSVLTVNSQLQAALYFWGLRPTGEFVGDVQLRRHARQLRRQATACSFLALLSARPTHSAGTAALSAQKLRVLF